MGWITKLHPFLAFRENIRPWTRYYRRTLEEDLAWTRLVIVNARDAAD